MTLGQNELEAKSKKAGFFSYLAGGAGRKLKRLRKLLPHVENQRLEAPVDKVLSLVHTLGNLSFRAYNDPTVEGWTEVTPFGNRIKHVN